MVDYRVGNGYDVHRLVEDRSLIIGGVTIPYEKGLLGHSDADVLIHAIMDALLGAAAMGDIGQHFPDNDPQYEGISSLLLSSERKRLVGREHRRHDHRPEAEDGSSYRKDETEHSICPQYRTRQDQYQSHHRRRARFYREGRGDRRPGSRADL